MALLAEREKAEANEGTNSTPRAARCSVSDMLFGQDSELEAGKTAGERRAAPRAEAAWWQPKQRDSRQGQLHGLEMDEQGQRQGLKTRAKGKGRILTRARRASEE